MGKRAILSVFIDFQIPNDGSKQYDWAIDKKIALFQNPRPVEVKHDGIGCFVGIGYIRHKVWIERIASVASARVIKVDDVKFGLYLILIGMFQQMVVSNRGKVVKLEIVDVHRKPLFDVLLDVVVYDGVGFSGAGRAKHRRGSKRVDDINPTVIPFAFIIEFRRKINGVFIFHQTGFLLETLVFIIENIVHQIVAE